MLAVGTAYGLAISAHPHWPDTLQEVPSLAGSINELVAVCIVEALFLIALGRARIQTAGVRIQIPTICVMAYAIIKLVLAEPDGVWGDTKQDVLITAVATTATCALSILWVPANPDRLANTEQRLLEHTLPNCDITTHPVESTAGVHTLEVSGSAEKPVLVLLHGYGHGAATWFLAMESLAKRYRVLSIDAPGMGRSLSPHKSFPREPKAAVEFFVEGIEQWRVAMGLDKVTLLGHSLGGYIFAQYAMRYPQHVSVLLLLSPVGVPTPPAEHTLNSTIFRIVRAVWGSGVTPAAFGRALGPLGSLAVARFSHFRFQKLDSEQRVLLGAYLYQHNCRLPVCAEHSITVVLKPGARASLPIIEDIDKLRVPTGWIYGRWDWMDADAGEEARRQMVQAGVKSLWRIVEHSGHQIYYENAEGMLRVVEDLARHLPHVPTG